MRHSSHACLRGLVSYVALLLVACVAQAGGILTAPQAQDQVKAGTITLIDIRTPEEWRQTGVAAGAVPINMLSPKPPQGFLEALLVQVKGNRDAPIALICRTGNRSTQLQRFLEEQGFSRVYNVKEGMAGSMAGPGWINRGLPVDSCRQC